MFFDEVTKFSMVDGIYSQDEKVLKVIGKSTSGFPKSNIVFSYS